MIRLPVGAYIREDDPGESGYKTTAPRGSVTDGECALLGALCRGQFVLEIGTGLGVSTRAIAATALRVDTVDPDPWVQSAIVPSFSEENIRAFTEVPGGQYDVAFIDGNHSEESVLSDIRAAAERLHRGGLLILHDTHLEGVFSACSKFGIVPFDVQTELHIGLVTV
jgi:precorrin-6B methylase 2